MTGISTGSSISFGVAGARFASKALYELSIALVLPMTQGALYVSAAKTRVAAAFDAIELQPGQLLVDLGCVRWCFAASFRM